MKWLWTAILLYIIIFGAVTSLRHYNFQTQAWDLGIFTQILWNIAHGNGMNSTLEFVENHFAVHMSPILYLLAPGYLVFQSPYYLLIVQTIALALGAWPLYLLAKNNLSLSPPLLTKERGLGGEVISSFVKTPTSDKIALTVAIAYLLYPSLHWINWFDFHPIAFLVPFLLSSFYFLETRQWWWMALFLALAASAQEDAILVVAFFGIYLIFRKEIIQLSRRADNPPPSPSLPVRQAGLTLREGARGRVSPFAAGFLILLFSALYFFLSIKLIMPYFGGGLLRLDRYSQLGASFGEILKNLFTHPSLFFQTIFMWPKFMYLFWLLIPVAFLPLLAPRELILLMPGLAQNLLTLYPNQFSGTFQYDAVLIPGIFIAVIYGIKNANDLFAGLMRRAGWVRAKRESEAQSPRASRAGASEESKKVICVLAITVVLSFLLRSPISPLNFPREFFYQNEHWVAFREMVKKVPLETSVAAHTNLVPHLASREKIYMLGYEPLLEPDILLIDGADYFGFPTPEAFQSHIQKYAESGKYNAEIINDRYYILRKKPQHQNFPEGFEHNGKIKF